jgi:NADPH2:quinone reductase
VATIHAGDTVLIRAAAGGVGLWLTQMAVARGATVIATTRSAGKCDRLRALGAVPVVTNGSAGDLAALRTAAPGGYDLIFDSLGGAEARRSWGLLAHGGRMVCFGVATMAASGWSRLLAPLRALEFGLFHPLVFLSSSRGLIGVNMLRVADARPAAMRAVTERAVALVADGTVKLELSRRPASELPAAHEALERGATVGKLVMEWPT